MRIVPQSSASAVGALAGGPAAGLDSAPLVQPARRESLRQAYRGAFAVSLVSKVAGFIRELLIAYTFGASPVASLYFTAVQIPTYVQSFFFGAFALPMVPALRTMHAHGAGAQFRRQVLKRSTLVVGSAALLGWAAVTLADARPAALETGQAAWFLAPLFLCCIAIPAAGLAYCELLARGDTTRASALPAMMNISGILVLGLGLFCFGNLPLVLSVSAAVGIVVQALFALRQAPAREPAPLAADLTTARRKYRRGVWLALFENASFAGAFFWQTQLYGLSMAGGTALFFYAYRIANFPFLLLVAPAQQLAFRLGAGGASERTQRARVYLAIAFVGLSAAAALAWFGPPVIQWVYQRGVMTADWCAGVASLAAPICLSLLALALVQTAGRYLSQHGGHGVYVATVVPMYFAANGARLAVAGGHDLATTALAGAAVEFCAAAFLVALTLKPVSK